MHNIVVKKSLHQRRTLIEAETQHIIRVLINTQYFNKSNKILFPISIFPWRHTAVEKAPHQWSSHSIIMIIPPCGHMNIVVKKALLFSINGVN
jgi:hypothetical protein